MRWQKKLLLRLRSLFQRAAIEHELDDELQFHLEAEIEESIGRGLSAEDARAQALQRFGSPESFKESCRDQRGLLVVDELRQDIRQAVRLLSRDWRLTLTVTATLAICIGANTTAFSMVRSVLLRPLPFDEPQQLYWLSERMGRETVDIGLGGDYYSLREKNRVFTDVGAYDNTTVNWSGGDRPEQLDAVHASASFFRTFGTKPPLGRMFSADEEGSKAPAVIVLSYGFWRSRLHADALVVGRTILLDGLPNVVIGVMPPGFDYPKGTALWKPLDMDEADQRVRLPEHPIRLVEMIARARSGARRSVVDAELSRLGPAIRREYPKQFEAMGFLENFRVVAAPLQSHLTGNVRPALLVLSGAVLLVLMVACANIANLLLARTTARHREFAIRLALGCSSSRILSQLLMESLILILPGTVLGLAAAYANVSLLHHWMPSFLESQPPIAIDWQTLSFTVATSLLTGLFFGMIPAWTAFVTKIQEALKQTSSAQTVSRRARSLRQALLMTELSVCLMLLIGTALLGRSFVNLARVPLGFSPSGILTLRTNLTTTTYTSAQKQQQFYQGVERRLKSLPFIRDVALSTDVPLAGKHPYSIGLYQVVGRPALPLGQQPMAASSIVSERFFSVLRVPLRAGRFFNRYDTQRSRRVVLINEALAAQTFPHEDPVGGDLYSGPNRQSRMTIIGVVGNIRGNELGATPSPVIYHCDTQIGDTVVPRVAFFIDVAGDRQSSVQAIEHAISEEDRTQPVIDVKTMSDRVNSALAPERFHLLVIGIFTAIALLLASVGVYGVMSYLLARRVREIGIRLALGASARQITRLVMNENFVIVSISVVLGIAGASMLTRYLQSMLYQVTPLDGRSFLLAPALLILLTAVASWLPAQKACHTDPSVVLREE